MSEPVPTKKPRTRSPAYPAIDLQEAIAKAAVLYEKLEKHWGAAETVVQFWGFDADSSTGYSAISALIKFGLLEDQGSGDKREVRLTEVGKGLVFQADPGSVEHKAALKRAALLPAIHAELWKKWEGVLPDDSVVERHLVLDRGFNTAYVKGFIKQFKRTIAFAGLNPSDTVRPTDEEQTIQPTPSPRTVPASAPQFLVPHRAQLIPEPPVAQSSTDTRREIRLPPPAGDITIRGPFPMSSADWTTFTALMTAFRTWLVKDEPTSSSSALPQQPAQSPSDDLESY